MAIPSGPIDASAFLDRLVGRWRGVEIMGVTPWSAGGQAASEVEAELALGGAFLFQSYRQFRTGLPDFEARSVFGLDKASGQVLMYLFDSMGFIPAAPAVGMPEERELVFTRSSPRGRGQHRFSFEDDGSYRLVVRFAPPEGAWGTVMAGHYNPSLLPDGVFHGP